MGNKNKKRFFFGLVGGRQSARPTTNVIFYHGPQFEDVEIYPLERTKEVLNHRHFDQSRKTVLYVHGYLETQKVESIRVVVDAYLERNDYNILVLDWADLADGNYLLSAVPRAQKLGPQVAKVLLEVFNEGLSIEKFHLVGHSLGGQMSGSIGREIVKQSGGSRKLKRISALDPAFPPFYTGIYSNHITKHDADFVDVIHTDAWLYGAPVSTGTVDFWPNGGKTTQPGCPRRNYQMLTENDLCSHRRSWRFWAESVSKKYTQKFYAVKAANWKKFKQQNTPNTDALIEMGIDCPTNITGDYYLQTNGAPPFARGPDGVKHIPRSQLPGQTAY